MQVLECRMKGLLNDVIEIIEVDSAFPADHHRDMLSQLQQSGTLRGVPLAGLHVMKLDISD